MPNAVEKVVNVTKCNAVHQGTNRLGDAFTIYAIEGLDENDLPIERKLNSFADLPLGRAVYDVSRFEKKRDDGTTDVSFTLKPKKGAARPAAAPPQQQAPPPGQQQSQTGGAVTRQEYDALSERVRTIESLLASRAQAPDISRPAAGESASERWGDEAPW